MNLKNTTNMCSDSIFLYKMMLNVNQIKFEKLFFVNYWYPNKILYLVEKKYLSVFKQKGIWANAC